MKQRVFLAAALLAVLAACSSGVPLDNVPVEDKTGVTAPKDATGPAGGGQTSVAPVQADLAASDKSGPTNVSRIIYFDYDSNEIKPEFRSLLEAHARYLKANARRHVVIEGNTDERGGSEYNLALGQRRSEAVRQALELLGVPTAQMESVSFGKEKPAVDGHDESAWSQNRRAEIAYR
jgi:peptidoglycan-associated lipoprotein